MWSGGEILSEYWLEYRVTYVTGPAKEEKINLGVCGVDDDDAEWETLTSAAEFLVCEGQQQVPFLVAGSQVASAASICETFLSLWHRTNAGKGGEDDAAGVATATVRCRRALLLEAIHTAKYSEEEAPEREGAQQQQQQCRAWLTPRELELCRGILRRCGGRGDPSQIVEAAHASSSGEAGITSTLCSAAGNCVFHGIDVLSSSCAADVDLALLNAPLTDEEADGGCGVDFDFPNGAECYFDFERYRRMKPPTAGGSEEPAPAGYTALHAACHFHSPSVILFLLAIGADPRPLDAAHWAPLRLLVARRDLAAIGGASVPRRMPSAGGTAELYGSDADRLLVGMVGVFSDVFGFDGFSAWPDGRGGRSTFLVNWLYGIPFVVLPALVQSEVFSTAPRGQEIVRSCHPSAYCHGPPFVSMHAMAACYDRGMRPTRHGITTALNAPRTRACPRLTKCNEDDGLVAALLAAGRAMRREGDGAGGRGGPSLEEAWRGIEKEALRAVPREEVTPVSLLPPSFVADTLTELIDGQKARCQRPARTAAVIAAVASLPHSAMARKVAAKIGSNNLLLKFIHKSSLLFRNTDGLSTPHTIAIVDALASAFGGAYCDFLSDSVNVMSDPMLESPSIFLRVLWRGGYIAPVYPRGEANASRHDGYRIGPALDGTASLADPFAVIRRRAQYRSWRIVRALPFSLRNVWASEKPDGSFEFHDSRLNPLCEVFKESFSVVSDLANCVAEIAAARVAAAAEGECEVVRRDLRQQEGYIQNCMHS